MIGPRMATMLAFFLTDARVGRRRPPADPRRGRRGVVQLHLGRRAHEHQRHRPAPRRRGRGGAPLRGADLAAFAALVRDGCIELARMIPDDGEGATHLITIDVEGCRDREEARTIARAVADSPLVKTAIHGADPNWGRIVSAAGYAGVAFEERDLSLWLNGVALYRDGVPLPFDAAALSAQLRAERETHIRLVLTRTATPRAGSGPAT